MHGVVPLGQSASLSAKQGLSLPEGAMPPGSRPTVAVAAAPGHPSDAVLVVTRRDGGPHQFARGVRQTTPEHGGPQWFNAALPPVEAGRRLDYRVELSRAGQCLATLPADGSWLTVTGDPALLAPPPQPCPTPSLGARPSAAVPRWAYEMSFLGALTLDLRADDIGETPEGYRVNFMFEKGRLVGPRIDAVTRDGGDFMCIRRDGIGRLDVRTTYETVDGALIFDRAGGYFDLGPDGYAKVAAGRLEGSPPLYATANLSTAHPKYAWLNRVPAFGIGKVALEQLQVQCDIYIPRVLDRLSHA
jgi:Protein of unknown function (DUF3237)